MITTLRTFADYGKEYLSRQLPDNFDMSVLNTEYIGSVGNKILNCKGGSPTSYGIISGIGQELYSAITVQEEDEEQEDDESEDEAEGLEACLT